MTDVGERTIVKPQDSLRAVPAACVPHNFIDGELAQSGLRVGCIAETHRPDLDNANVGKSHAHMLHMSWSGDTLRYRRFSFPQAEKGRRSMELKHCLERVRSTTPLIHNITNYVTVNDVANALLACGASPIMADDAEEAEDITAICGGLNINIGTLNQRTIPAMLLAGKRAAELGHPTVLDPVGAGASPLRTGTAARLMEEIPFTVIRGNISEIKTLARGAGTTRGVDADVADAVTEDNLAQAVAFANSGIIENITENIEHMRLPVKGNVQE